MVEEYQQAEQEAASHSRLLIEFSRKIVGWQIHDTECAQYAADLIRQTRLDEALEAGPHYLQADNGTAMKATTLLATLQRSGVIPSFSRPGVSNDNPCSEPLFRTVKYCPRYPERPFDTLEHARLWMGEFTDWYNHQHLHSGIRFVTPAQRHQGIQEMR